ncbi:MAG TPA: nuclear transport factor 2 family protein, partial [Bacteroidia bacterium]|nr:nuclear transport factor 2 family protein [Bacteroidia bacterium]
MSVEEEVMNSHTAFWQGYAERNLDKRFSVCADDVTFFGTGVHERAVGKKQYREMNETGLKQSPEPFQINLLWKHLRIYGDIAWVECDTEWIQGIGGRTTNDLIRQTTIFKLENGKWLVKHVHGSEPDYRLKAGEYMVNEEVAKRNSELERQVFERTRELENEKQITEQKSKELELTLENLRTTQKQLIHSEKMASLGLLTSGVAHELKNPLNFVNNFAQISRDLIADYNTEESAEEKLILLQDLERNLEKIVHHGKRADNIVASMLMHSRMGNTKRVKCNINQLIDEAISVSTLNEREKNENFLCYIKTDYDSDLPQVSVIHQDFSLVMMNIIYNAIYATNQKKQKAPEHYNPEISI